MTIPGGRVPRAVSAMPLQAFPGEGVRVYARKDLRALTAPPLALVHITPRFNCHGRLALRWTTPSPVAWCSRRPTLDSRRPATDAATGGPSPWRLAGHAPRGWAAVAISGTHRRIQEQQERALAGRSPDRASLPAMDCSLRTPAQPSSGLLGCITVQREPDTLARARSSLRTLGACCLPSTLSKSTLDSLLLPGFYVQTRPRWPRSHEHAPSTRLAPSCGSFRPLSPFPPSPHSLSSRLDAESSPCPHYRQCRKL